MKNECCFYISWVKKIFLKSPVTIFHTQRLFSKVKQIKIQTTKKKSPNTKANIKNPNKPLLTSSLQSSYLFWHGVTLRSWYPHILILQVEGRNGFIHFSALPLHNSEQGDRNGSFTWA